MKKYYVYIMASKKNGTLYIGVTSNLIQRTYKHKMGWYDGFTKRYQVDKLVYFEETNEVMAALEREKRLKKWNRQWKINLIKSINPEWRDLSEDFVNSPDRVGNNKR